MCGIAGKVDVNRPVDPQLLARMCEAIRHRGPDSRGIHCSDGVGLGIQRLAVIDLSTGDQPIYNEDRSVVVVLNGEIYNYLELRDELARRGHVLATSTDTEVIVHLYEELGLGCVERLRGMFAFALWDERQHRLMLARDRVGKKPLFYRVTPSAIWFASEPGAMLRDPEVPRDVDTDAIDSYLRFQYVPQPLCAFRALRKLPPAHVLSWRGGAPELSRYWRLRYDQVEPCSIEDAVVLVRESLLEATKLRLRSDVPLGAFLSGGIDSSAVVAAMAMQGHGQIKTFSIGFDVDTHDETPFARAVAQRYDCDHQEFRVEADAVGIVPQLVWHYGEPFADSSALPSFYLSALTRRHVTVALNGDGGDEVFAGYRRYAAAIYADRLRLLPSSIRQALAAQAQRLGRGRDARTFRDKAIRLVAALGDSPRARYDNWMSYFTREDLDRLYQPGYAHELPGHRTAERLLSEPWNETRAPDFLTRMLDVDIQTYLPGDLLVKIDIAAMAHSLEVRSPFLDHVLMERVARLPGSLKLRRGKLKFLLKQAVAPWLPESVINRPKMGFGVPIASWLRGPLRALPERVLLDPVAVDRGMFRSAGVRRLIDDHHAGRRDNSSQLWSLLQLELWFRTYIDVAEPKPVTLAVT